MSIARLKELIRQPDNQRFIEKYRSANVAELLFKFHHDDDKRLLIEQIANRQRIRKKLPQWYKNPELLFPPTVNLEQSSSEATAALKSRYFKGNNFCDLSGGLGIDFYHFAQHFENSTYVEPNSDLFDLAQHNFEILNISHRAFCSSAEEVLKTLPKQDLLYLDPSRRSVEQSRVINLEDYHPNVVALQQLLLSKGETVLIKVSPMLDIQAAFNQLPGIVEIWIVGVKNECKEMLLMLNREEKPAVEVRTWNLAQREEYFSGKWQNTSELPKLCEPQQYLYEPNSSILKGGLANALAIEMGLSKLHPHSNFHTANKFTQDYPGRKFRIQKLHKPFNKSLKKKRFNVISRNFPEKASQIEQKLQLKPANKEYLIATQTENGLIFIECKLEN